jgi:hypothetical protein
LSSIAAHNVSPEIAHRLSRVRGYAAVLDHWLNTGLPVEGRRGSSEFDVSFYLQSYPDLKAAFGKNYVAALDHWIIQGVREGRKGAPSA